MRDRASLLALAAGAVTLAAVLADATPLLRGPAPYPPEWRWELRAGGTSGRYLPAAACGAALVGLLALVHGPQAARRACLALAAAVPLGLGFQLALLAIEPEGALPALVRRTTSRTVTSYHSVALSPMASDARAFLAAHHDLLVEMRHGAKHASTHPPGPVLFYRGLLALFEARPALAARFLALAGMPDPDRRPPARAAALAGALLILLACALTAWPVAALARAAGLDAAAASRAGLLWTLLPGPALMAPQFDQALALPVAAAAAGLALAMAAPAAPARAAWSLAAGAAAAAALFVSYGAAVFVVLTGGAALAAVVHDRAGLRRAAGVGAAAALSAAAALGVTVLLGHRPWRSAAVALAQHRETFTAPRDYALWLLFNPVDLALFAGVPVAVLFLAAAWRAARGLRGGALAAGDRFALAGAAGILVLLLTGTVRGEVGRIWIPLMPLLLVPAAARLGRRWEAPAVGALLALLCLALRFRWEVG